MKLLKGNSLTTYSLESSAQSARAVPSAGSTVVADDPDIAFADNREMQNLFNCRDVPSAAIYRDSVVERCNFEIKGLFVTPSVASQCCLYSIIECLQYVETGCGDTDFSR